MIKGKVVGLRALEKEDLPQLKNWRNNPSQRKFFREVNELNDFNQNKWFESICDKNSINKMFAIIKLDTNEIIGVCGLCYIDWVNRSADFSIYIGYEDLYIDEVFAIEAAELMRTYGFEILNLHRLWAEIYSIDEKKKVFFDSLGFKLDGELKETYWFENKWHNSLYYSYLSTFNEK
ncbi:GNAT family N-acetyltransferase [Poseidonibacter lekithochrous]|uniref:GNAT family N-acetyltransferase n=1 Tax=Poseidonibacter lekithochrous TaxID=1904463 RepID=UPI0008FC9A9F|nr:GNAT family protein [Poseidonibacter lekithochrous]QKJ24483.1 acetyltransferase [Poseidonibacter lekithochrous]